MFSDDVPKELPVESIDLGSGNRLNHYLSEGIDLNIWDQVIDQTIDLGSGYRSNH